MEQYKQALRTILNEGVRKPNRTGTDTLGVHGMMMKFDMADGFPLVTLKKTAYKTAFAEMLGFVKAYDNAADFRALGCKVWDQNANENEAWLANKNRKGRDDLGSIYGVQSRKWPVGDGRRETIDQLQKVVNHLAIGVDDRREIVSHWNPAEFHKMALLPCHLLYQFGIQGDRLNLTMYQRSCDFFLGVPFNIAGYSWLLHVIAHITGYKPGVFTHMMHDCHIYVDHIEGARTMLEREPLGNAKITMPGRFGSLSDLETWIRPEDFLITEYEHHPAIKGAMAV